MVLLEKHRFFLKEQTSFVSLVWSCSVSLTLLTITIKAETNWKWVKIAFKMDKAAFKESVHCLETTHCGSLMLQSE